jgi:hypothetical protein
MSARFNRSSDAPGGTSSLVPGRGGGRGGGRHAQGAGRGGGRGSGSAGFAAPVVPNELTKVDFLKLAKDFPTFSGDNGVQPEDYLIQFSKMAKFTDFTSQQLLEVLPLKFTSIADTWLSELQSTPAWEDIMDTEDPFDGFCQLFIKRFSFGDRNQLARDKLRSLEWRGNVVKLASLIQQHSAHTNITDSEQCDCFIQLLPTAMAKHVMVTRTTLGNFSFSDAITMAVNYASVSTKETPVPRSHGGTFAGQRKKPYYPGQKKTTFGSSGQTKAPPVTNRGVLKNKTGVKPSVSGPRCWQCGGRGHIKRDCPQKHVSFNMMEIDKDEQSK